MNLCRWSLIAGRVPGRTDNQVKNHWNTHLCKKLGLKKQNRKDVGTSKKHFTQPEQTNNTLSSNSDAKAMEVSQNENPLLVADGEASNGEVQWMSNHFAESLPLFQEDSPGLLDFLDDYHFDLAWQSF